MSRLILNEKYLGYISNPNTDKKVLQVKKYFLLDIKKTRYFKGKLITYARAEISDDECWYKFMFGDEKHHNFTKNIDLSRVSRSHWLFIIIDYLNNTLPENYDQNIKFQLTSKKRETVQVNLKKGLYQIVIQHLNKDKVMIITAFYKGNK